MSKCNNKLIISFSCIYLLNQIQLLKLFLLLSFRPIRFSLNLSFLLGSFLFIRKLILFFVLLFPTTLFLFMFFFRLLFSVVIVHNWKVVLNLTFYLKFSRATRLQKYFVQKCNFINYKFLYNLKLLFILNENFSTAFLSYMFIFIVNILR
jgi:hypothetical protein